MNSGMRIACYLRGSLQNIGEQAQKENHRFAEQRYCDALSANDQRGGIMARKRKSQFVLPEKQCWHLYSLQNLHPEKFIKVVGKILKKDYLLIK
jgi:hypothetical protein